MNLGRHALDPREIRIVEHPRLLDMPPRIDYGTRRRAHARIDAVVLEDNALFCETVVCRSPIVRRQLAGDEAALLVGQYKEYVVWCAGIPRCLGPRGRNSSSRSSGNTISKGRGNGPHAHHLQRIPTRDGNARPLTSSHKSPLVVVDQQLSRAYFDQGGAHRSMFKNVLSIVCDLQAQHLQTQFHDMNLMRQVWVRLLRFLQSSPVVDFLVP